jgi:CheY-like chemotaxis protein
MVVEDNKADVFLIREAIQSAHLDAELHVMPDGERAIRFFHDVDSDNAKACPVLVIIDINLPRRSGGEVLQHMRKSRRCANSRVVVVTSSDSARDREEMARLGVDAYFRKASDYEAFL